MPSKRRIARDRADVELAVAASDAARQRQAARRSCGRGPAPLAPSLDGVDLAGAAAADVDHALAVGVAAERHLARIRELRRSAARCESPTARAACRSAAPPGCRADREREAQGGARVDGEPVESGRRVMVNDVARGAQRGVPAPRRPAAARPTFAPAPTISAQVTASTGMPARRRVGAHRPLGLARRLDAIERRPAAARPSRQATNAFHLAPPGWPRCRAAPASTMIENMLLRTRRRPSVTGAAGRAAGERAAEQLADQRQAGALVLAERQQRADRLDHRVARVGGRLAVVVDDRAGLERDALVVGDARLALGDLAGREVEHDRLAARARNADAERDWCRGARRGRRTARRSAATAR